MKVSLAKRIHVVFYNNSLVRETRRLRMKLRTFRMRHEERRILRQSLMSNMDDEVGVLSRRS